MLKSYLKNVHEIANRGDAREESYYSALESLLKEYVESVNKRNVHITTLPKKTEAGNPDFRLWDGKQHIVGYIEAKPPTVHNLDDIEDSDQLERYLTTFPNLILTNFFEFRIYRDGALSQKTFIARPYIVHKLKTIPPVENKTEFLELLEKFFSFSLPKVYEAKTLAIELAKRTRFLKDEVVTQELIDEDSTEKSFISGFYEAFKKYLISGLTKEDFADLYSQTITYGLFAARTRSENGFNRKLAYDRIPRTIGILRDVFRFISLGDLPQQMEWIVDDISEVLAVTDVKNLLHQYFHEGKGKDPIVHFYETFLTQYDPETRERRGVYYTPEAVVSYIVRSLHLILKEKFGKSDGFADGSVTVLDPAAGTLTFLAEAAKLAVEEFVSKYGEGGKENFIKENILKNYYAFELMMAPYAVGHLKISFLLEELGYKLQKDDRFKFYLTNTLEMEELAQTELPGMASLSEESHLAGKVKKEQPILVILGNPPYQGISANSSEKKVTIGKGDEYITNYQIQEDKINGSYKLIPRTKRAKRQIIIKQKTWIGELIEYYKYVDGKHFREKKHWLQNDYVKFIRFAQWKIEQVGEGILGFITDHSYLDSPTFRGMRQFLMSSFNEVYILDVHGNSLKKEKCPDGSKDENVFDIQQGVAIALFVKKRGKKECKVYHSERWGLRDEKYDWLYGNDLKKTKWDKLNPSSPYYFFVPRIEEGKEIYEKYWKLKDIFTLNSVGIVTGRNRITIKLKPEEMWNTVLSFSRMETELARQAYNLGKDSRDWTIETAQKDLKDSGLDKNMIVQILVQPFDIRYTYYTGNSRGFYSSPQSKVMRHMFQENLGLVLPKRVETRIPWRHALCTVEIVDHVAVSLKTIDDLFPLYLYPDTDKKDLFDYKGNRSERKPNLNEAIVKTLSEAYVKDLFPEEIFYYIYAVLYSNTYRTKYAEFIKIDFPRVPFTKDYEAFRRMAELGKRLIDLHLLKSSELDAPIAKFQGKGDDKVEKIKYEPVGQTFVSDTKESLPRIYLNNDQYFEGIRKEVWEYQIGGYQVCEKWLKDRKGRRLSLYDIKHYCKVVTAIQKTIEIQSLIDVIYPEVEKEIIEFKKE